MKIISKSNWFIFKIKDYPFCDERYVYSSESEFDSEIDLNKLAYQIENSLINKSNLIILRLADGEFQFLFGKKISFKRLNISLLKNIFNYVKSYFGKFHIVAATAPGISSGKYSKNDVNNYRSKAFDNIIYLSKKGILALYLIKKKSFDISNYFESIDSFLSRNKIKLSSNNYHPFYFVYIILLNSRFNYLFSGKSVLIVTGDVHRKKEKTEKYLYQKGFYSVDWYCISSERSIFDSVLIPQNKYDFIFIAAGIGKLVLIDNFFQVNAVVIDIGFVLEIMNNPSLSKSRDYCAFV
jgi:hypothetical protein